MINCVSSSDVACSPTYSSRRRSVRLIKCCIAAKFLLKTNDQKTMQRTFNRLKNKINSASHIDAVLTECGGDETLRATETIDVIGKGNIIRNGQITSLKEYLTDMRDDSVGVFLSKTISFAFRRIDKLRVACARYDKAVKTAAVKTSDFEKYLHAAPGEIHVLDH